MTDRATAWVERFWPLILLLITALGAFLRLFRLRVLPPAAGYDAAQYGLDALQIIDGARPVFLTANFGREPLFSYLVALIFQLGGPGEFGVHLSSALIGIATIPAVYLAARTLLSAENEFVKIWAPLLASLVTAVSYWHLNFSRAGLRAIWVPLFAALLTAALWYGLQRGRKPALALAGILLGLSQYTYQAARLLPLLALAAFVYTYLSRRAFRRRDAVDMLLTFGLALLVFLPLGRFAVEQPQVFNDRLRQASLLDADSEVGAQVASLSSQALRTVRMFFVEGDHEPQLTIPGRPSLNPFLAAAFLAGFGIALWRWKWPCYLYLLTWLALLTAPAMLAGQAATAKRALGAFPAVAILIAVGLAVPYFFIVRRAVERSRRLAALLALILLAGLVWTAVRTYGDYFIRWGEDPSLAAHFERDHTEIGLAAARAAPQTAVLVSPFPAYHPAIQLNSGRRPGLRSYDGHRCLPLPDASDGLTYLIVPGEAEHSIERLQALFPDGSLSAGPARADRDEPYFQVFRVPRGSEPELRTDAALLNWQGQIELVDFDVSPREARPGDTLQVTLTYRALVKPDDDYTAFLHLLFAGEERLLSQDDSEPCGGALRTGSWRSGDLIIDTVEIDIPPEAAPGQYDLRIGFYAWPELTPLLTGELRSGFLETLHIR